MTRNRRGIHPAAVLVPAAVAVAAGLLLFYAHRSEGFDADEFPLPVMYYIYAHRADTTAAGAEAEEDRMPPGAWFPARDGGGSVDSLDQRRRDEIEELRSLGYLAGYHEAPIRQGVTVHDSVRAWAGYNLIVSGHGPGVLLLDMEGEVVHEWYTHFDQLAVWPGSEDVDMEMQFWTRAMAMPDSGLIALIENLGIARLDKESDTVWVSGYIQPHHDFDVGPDDSIYAICKEVYVDEDYNSDAPIVDELVGVLSPEGELVRTINIRHALAASRYAPVLRRMPPEGDILHANTLEYIQGDFSGSIAPLREGTLLLSLRTIDLVCALDPQTEEVYWAESDLWYKQHQPTMLENGNMLVFDNRGFRQDSRVLEIDPATREVAWSYRGGGDQPHFFSVGRGSNQRLPNGNTLIIESNQGRALEVTREGEIVWEWISPYRAGDNRELIATLFEIVRYPPGYME